MKLIIVIALLLIPFTVHAKTDWSVATVESTMKRYPTAKISARGATRNRFTFTANISSTSAPAILVISSTSRIG
jgi:hypothetical protein